MSVLRRIHMPMSNYKLFYYPDPTSPNQCSLSRPCHPSLINNKFFSSVDSLTPMWTLMMIRQRSSNAKYSLYAHSLASSRCPVYYVCPASFKPKNFGIGVFDRLTSFGISTPAVRFYLYIFSDPFYCSDWQLFSTVLWRIIV